MNGKRLNKAPEPASKQPASTSRAVPKQVNLGTADPVSTSGLRGGDLSDGAPLAPGGATQQVVRGSSSDDRRTGRREGGADAAFRLASTQAKAGRPATPGSAQLPTLAEKASPDATSSEVMAQLASRAPKNLWGED
jgi:hypothetical protein